MVFCIYRSVFQWWYDEIFNQLPQNLYRKTKIKNGILSTPVHSKITNSLPSQFSISNPMHETHKACTLIDIG